MSFAGLHAAAAAAERRALLWADMARGKRTVCEVRSRPGADGERFFIDFGRRARPRFLYSFRGVPFETRGMAEAIAAHVEMELAKERALEDVLSELRPGGGEAAIAPLLARWVALMEREAAAGIRSPNYVRELARWAAPDGHFSFWSGMSVHEIDRANLREWVLWMAERGLGAKTAKNVMAGLRSFATWLSDVRPSFTPPRRWPWPEPVEHVPTVVSLEVQAAILAAIPDPERGLFLSLARLGLRPSEARVLRVRDWTGDELRVERARKGRTLSSPVRGPKKARGAKVLPVPPDLRAWLEVHVSAERRLGDPDGPLFVHGRSGWWSEAASRRTWYAACERAGVRVSLYEGTKHSLATALKGAGVDDRVIARLLGHGDPRSVERYGRVQTAVVSAALARLRLKRGPTDEE